MARPTATPGGGVSSFAIADDQHVYYVANDQHVHQLFFDNTKWMDQDLTAATGGPAATAGGGVSSFAIAYDQHVYYVANENGVEDECGGSNEKRSRRWRVVWQISYRAYSDCCDAQSVLRRAIFHLQQRCRKLFRQS